MRIAEGQSLEVNGDVNSVRQQTLAHLPTAFHMSLSSEVLLSTAANPFLVFAFTVSDLSLTNWDWSM